MDILTTYGTILLGLAIIFGVYMTWGIGANDVANAMGTSVGARAITVKQAIMIAAVFEFAGAFIAGGNVTSTIRKGIVDPSGIADSPETDDCFMAGLAGFDHPFYCRCTGRLRGGGY
jgi:PiT family inorganic phosphate transporter